MVWGCVTEPDQTSPSSVTQTFDLSKQKPLRPHLLGTAEDQTVTVLVCVAKPNSRLRPDWEPCGPQRSYPSGLFPVAWLPACSCGLLLPEYNEVLSHPAAWTLPSCPPCAMLCPPRRQLLTHWTAQHRVLGQKDALALTLLWELGRSAPELAGPRSRQ